LADQSRVDAVQIYFANKGLTLLVHADLHPWTIVILLTSTVVPSTTEVDHRQKEKDQRKNFLHVHTCISIWVYIQCQYCLGYLCLSNTAIDGGRVLEEDNGATDGGHSIDIRE
jgi:hypothetical protein